MNPEIFDRAMDILEEGLSNIGICIACGVEPDAREYRCEVCNKMKVYGCEEILFMGA